MATGRNEKCPCGSGKKYKNCCLQKDMEAAREKELAALTQAEDSAEPFEEEEEPKIPTWKILAGVSAVLLAAFLILRFACDLPRVGGAVLGVGMIVLIVFCAFRNVPTVRKRPGDAGNIDFGNRA